jgi:phosphohistidine phosphatase
VGEHAAARDNRAEVAQVRQLFVLRHAKSSWDHPGLDDHDRPLAPRGVGTVKVMAEHLRASGVRPALVLCSSARRARETLEGVRPAGEWLIEEGLYGADAGALLERLRQVPDEVPSVMLIGHNPGLQALVLRLADTVAGGTRPAEEQRKRLGEVRRKFPTGALATLTFDSPWRDLHPGGARLTGFVRPRQLTLS